MYLGCIWNKSGMYLECIRDVSGMYPDVIGMYPDVIGMYPDVFGMYPRTQQDIFGMYLGYIRDVSYAECLQHLFFYKVSVLKTFNLSNLSFLNLPIDHFG